MIRWVAQAYVSLRAQGSERLGLLPVKERSAQGSFLSQKKKGKGGGAFRRSAEDFCVGGLSRRLDRLQAHSHPELGPQGDQRLGLHLLVIDEAELPFLQQRA